MRTLIASGIGARVARKADLNNDGKGNVSNVTLYLNGGTGNVVRDRSVKDRPPARGLRYEAAWKRGGIETVLHLPGTRAGPRRQRVMHGLAIAGCLLDRANGPV